MREQIVRVPDDGNDSDGDGDSDGDNDDGDVDGDSGDDDGGDSQRGDAPERQPARSPRRVAKEAIDLRARVRDLFDVIDTDGDGQITVSPASPTTNNDPTPECVCAQGHELHHFLTAISGSRQHHVSNLRSVPVNGQGGSCHHWRCIVVQEIAQALQRTEEGHATVQRTPHGSDTPSLTVPHSCA